MTVFDFDNLPNGLHDACLYGVSIDYESEDVKVVLRIRVDLADYEKRTEASRIGLLRFDKVGYVAIDPPRNGLPITTMLEVDDGVGQPPDSPCPAMEFGAPYKLHYFVLPNTGGSYIRIAAKSYTFEWE